jgi:hypothetical protein
MKSSVKLPLHITTFVIMVQDVPGFRDGTMGPDIVRLSEELDGRTRFRFVAANVGHSPF